MIFEDEVYDARNRHVELFRQNSAERFDDLENSLDRVPRTAYRDLDQEVEEFTQSCDIKRGTLFSPPDVMAET